MKLKVSSASLIALFLSVASVAKAADTKVTPPLPCENLEKACEAGGFHKHGHKVDNGMWQACMQPLLQGKTVAGVTADAKDVAGCKDSQAKSKPL